MRFPTPTEWLKLVEEFRGSELQQKEFTAKHNVSLETFRYWLYKKAKHVQIESKPETKFLPVTVVASAAPKARQQKPSEVVVELPSGAVVRFAIGTDTEYLAELVAALG
ncbi:MAG: IS66 family insertion sequence element accessory protein TnpB [Archangium sp.]|nr:IS66 family insertion sequence element accessory protein TnpB [Archangium sp.]